MLAPPTAPGTQDEPRLTIKMVSIAERGTAMVTAIEAGQSRRQFLVLWEERPGLVPPDHVTWENEEVEMGRPWDVSVCTANAA